MLRWMSLNSKLNRIVGGVSKQIALLFVLTVFSVSSKAQHPEFLWASGNDASGRGVSVAADKDGNVFVAGYFSSTNADFGGIVLTNSTARRSLFIAKYDRTGKPMWVRQSEGGDVVAHSICADRKGSAYVTGFFVGRVSFGNERLVSGDTFSLGAAMFLLKIDGAGNFVWAQQAGEVGSNAGYGVAVDSDGNIGVTGLFSGTSRFGSQSLTAMETRAFVGHWDIFVAKYDIDGNVLWAVRAGSELEDAGHAIAFDSSGNAYVTGSFQLSASFGKTIITSRGGENIFVAKYDAAGNLLWVKPAGGGDSRGNGIALDGVGNAFVTGYFSGNPAIFGNDLLFTGSQWGNAFVAKYSTNGDLQWVRQAGGPSHDDAGLAIAVDKSGTAFVTGYFIHSASFGTTSLTSGANNQVFVAAWDSSGKHLWAIQPEGGGLNSPNQGSAISWDGLGNIYVSGFFGDTIKFGATTLVGHSYEALSRSISTDSFFLARVPVTPQLRIFQSRDAVILSWPVWASNFVLEVARDSTLSTQWVQVDVNPVAFESEYAVAFPTDDRGQFFRLRLR